MTVWLFETLLWTAVLIAGVLLLRRPVARWFGPQMAYALWAIPVLRLFMPPIQLPAWMRLWPADPGPVAANPLAQTAFETAPHNPIDYLGQSAPVATTNGPAATEAAAPVITAPITPASGIEFERIIEPLIGPLIGPTIQLAAAAWLIGAAIFIYLRFAAYFRLRAQLLDNSINVGTDGPVRLVETAGTHAPLAFGVIDKVIALPPGFLAQSDRTARDLALAHEMQHHRGHDLLVNILVQPLFAMHWFNPLGRYGWLALRRDQEAACDARVIAAKPAKTRQAYAHLIAQTAAGPALTANLALAAPMACPVLGEKSIIHRLRSLNMTDTSQKRRITGRFMLAAGVVALPLTASISYAASDPAGSAQAASARLASATGPLAGVPPVPPVQPVQPVQPITPISNLSGITAIDPDTGEPAETGEYTAVYYGVVDAESDEERTRQSTERAIERESRLMEIRREHAQRDKERLEEIMAEVRSEMEEANMMVERLPQVIEESLAAAGYEERTEHRTVVTMECDNSSNETATVTVSDDGTRTVTLCQERIMASALRGLRQARDQIASTRAMDSETRRRIVRELDEQIEEWESNQG